MRQASPAALRLSVWAYAHLLRAYPASFRAEFGGEMALLFSDCCRDEWRSAGPAGVCRLLARAALDTLVSAPPLWAERLEETMKGHSADRRWGFWLADHGLAMGGLALLAVGAATSWWAMSLGWAALAIAFFAWVAEADGLAVPRPGRVAIRTGGCGERPLAFTVRRGDRCSSSSGRRTPGRGWSSVYTVHDQPKGTRLRAASSSSFFLPATPAAGGRSVAAFRLPTCASSTTSGSATSRADRSSARCPRPGCEPTVSQDASRIGKLILVPAVITLAVTLLRLVGELQGWSPALFNRGDKPFSPSLVGIVWLVPVFGAWFGWKLTRAGSGPGSLGRAFGLTLASMAVLPLFSFLAPKAGILPERLWRPNVPLTESFTIVSVFVAFAIVGLAIGILAWPALGRTLLAYGLAARIPVALLMLVAMLGNWGTHYDARPSYPPDEHAWVVGRDRAGAAVLLLDLDHDRVRCAVRNRRRGDRAAAGNGSRLDSRTRRARGDVENGPESPADRARSTVLDVLRYDELPAPVQLRDDT